MPRTVVSPEWDPGAQRVDGGLTMREDAPWSLKKMQVNSFGAKINSPT